MIKRKLNIKRVVIAVFLLIIIIVSSVFYITNKVKKINSIEYKLELKGFNIEDINNLKSILTIDELNDFYLKNYDKNVIEYIMSPHFKYSKLDEYLIYDNRKTKYSINDIITVINVHAYEEEYENVQEVNTNLGFIMLVNKNNILPSDYVPNDVITIPESYAYKNVTISNDIYDSFIKLVESAKNAGFTLVASFGYRSYAGQESLYNEYKNMYGRYAADEIVAHAGASDHQTGFAIEIEPFDKAPEIPEDNDEYKWLLNNSYKYGFIQRYPKDKEYITKFEYEPWHFRYVGIEAATKIHNENLTLEEYYYYYIDNN